jgi:hypothetical protein
MLRLQQALSHLRVTRHAFLCQPSPPSFRARAAWLRWVRPTDFGNYPMGKTDRHIANWILAQGKPRGEKLPRP